MSIEATRKWQKANPEKVRAATQRYREKVDQIVWVHKATHPCLDCGEPDTIVLEFDHVRGSKVASIAQMKSQHLALERILEEIEKCEVRCANCHRRATYRRRAAKRNARLGLPRLVR